MDDQIQESLAELLEENGEVTLSNSEKQISIRSSEDNSEFPYVSSTHKQFEDVNEAIEWAILQFDDTENIEEWY